MVYVIECHSISKNISLVKWRNDDKSRTKMKFYSKYSKTSKNMVRKDINIVKKGITKPGVVIRDQCVLAGHDKHFQKLDLLPGCLTNSSSMV